MVKSLVCFRIQLVSDSFMTCIREQEHSIVSVPSRIHSHNHGTHKGLVSKGKTVTNDDHFLCDISLRPDGQSY